MKIYKKMHFIILYSNKIDKKELNYKNKYKIYNHKANSLN